MDCAVINNSTLVDSIPLNDEENVFSVIDNDADISANSDDSINNYTLQSKNHDGWDAVKKNLTVDLIIGHLMVIVMALR